MDYAHDRLEAAYTLDRVIELAESANEDPHTPRDEFDEDIDSWARRAQGANGFGDCS